ncbi:MAG TPA: histidine kinase dimerization/phosphoacceptor domain-containing protein, partial [Bryobacteraceae bacterium]|nr:histidine kinase dimerization/phosphoacceptor domain-containing protein [Bryobacteraceae bacterium]
MTESQRFLQRMIVSTINARDVESNRVSRLLHDEVGQVLSAVGLLLDVLKLDYRSQIPELTERVHEIQKMLENAVQQVRSLSYDLNPSVVER